MTDRTKPEIVVHQREGRPYFVDERHALYAGWIAGIAARNGYKVEIVADAQNNYTDKIILRLPALDLGAKGATTLQLWLAVPYPPDDWTFE